MLVVFNSIHMFIRINGVFAGYKYGENSFSVIGKWINSTTTMIFKIITSTLAGIIIGLMVFKITDESEVIYMLPGVTIFCIAVSLLLYKKRTLWVYIMPVFLSVVLAVEVIL
jgi:hypothetical protein